MATSPRLSLRGLRTFCVAAKHENFREAGEELFITPSAVSHQIKSLEQELNRELFKRSARDLKLTATGRSLYEEVAPLLDQLHEVTSSFRAGRSRSKLRLSVQPFFASELFVPRLPEFTTRYPEIEIQVGTSDESSEKHPKDADLSIRLFRKPPDKLVAHRLFPLRMAPSGSREFKKTIKVKNDRIVSNFPLLVHETRPKAWRQWEKASGIQLPTDSRVTRLDSMIAIVRAAEQGLGAALVPVPIAQQWFHQETIVPLFDHELVADVSYYLVVAQERENDEAVRLLSDWILDTFAE
ncbi:MAG: LysR substrate-binding domain-containing protein [Pseudomonadota bacterium]